MKIRVPKAEKLSNFLARVTYLYDLNAPLICITQSFCSKARGKFLSLLWRRSEEGWFFYNLWDLLRPQVKPFHSATLYGTFVLMFLANFDEYQY